MGLRQKKVLFSGIYIWENSQKNMDIKFVVNLAELSVSVLFYVSLQTKYQSCSLTQISSSVCISSSE